MINNQDASKLIIDYASAFIGSDRDIAEFKRTDFLIVLVEHIIEVLLNVVEIEENAQVATLHLQNNLIDQLINRVLILIFYKVTAVEDLILSLVLGAEVLHELKRVLLVVSDDHGMTRFKVVQVLLDEDVRAHLSHHLDISELKLTHLQCTGGCLEGCASKVSLNSLQHYLFIEDWIVLVNSFRDILNHRVEVSKTMEVLVSA